MSKIKYSIDDVNKFLDWINSVDPQKNTISLGGVEYQLTPVVSAGEQNYIDKVTSELSSKIDSISSQLTSSLSANNALVAGYKQSADSASKASKDTADSFKSVKDGFSRVDQEVSDQSAKIAKLRASVDNLAHNDLFLGLFEDADTLEDIHPTAKVASYAYVYDADSSEYILAVKHEGGWQTYSAITFSDVQTSSVYEGTVSQKTINLTLAINASIANRNSRSIMTVLNQLVDKFNELQQKVAYIEDMEYTAVPSLSLAPETLKKDDTTNALGLAGLPIELQPRE